MTIRKRRSGGTCGAGMLLEFERVRQEYEAQDAVGIPMSVRERYEKALQGLRTSIRRQALSGTGKRLGELLVQAGALKGPKLEEGLAEQHLRGDKELLGEVLLSLRLVSAEDLRRAVRQQVGVE